MSGHCGRRHSDGDTERAGRVRRVWTLEQFDSDGSSGRARILRALEERDVEPLGAIPEFPVEAFPQPMRSVLEWGIRDGLHVAGIGMAAIAGVAALLPRSKLVFPTEALPTVWIAIVADADSGKSPTMIAVLKPIIAADDAAWAQYDRAQEMGGAGSYAKEPVPVIATGGTIEGMIKSRRTGDVPHQGGRAGQLSAGPGNLQVRRQRGQGLRVGHGSGAVDGRAFDAGALGRSAAAGERGCLLDYRRPDSQHGDLSRSVEYRRPGTVADRPLRARVCPGNSPGYPLPEAWTLLLDTLMMDEVRMVERSWRLDGEGHDLFKAAVDRWQRMKPKVPQTATAVLGKAREKLGRG